MVDERRASHQEDDGHEGFWDTIVQHVLLFVSQSQKPMEGGIKNHLEGRNLHMLPAVIATLPSRHINLPGPP